MFHELVGPKWTTTTDNRDLIRSLVVEYRRMTYNMLQSTLGISSWAVSKILHEVLRLYKVRRWTHILSEYQKQPRVVWYKSMVVKFDFGKSNGVSQILIDDETWIYSYEPEKKTQTQVCVFSGDDAPTKVVRGRAIGKQMVVTFVGK